MTGGLGLAIGAVIRARRENAYLLQGELARRAGVSQSTLSRIEAGLRCDAVVAAALAREVGLAGVDDLIARATEVAVTVARVIGVIRRGYDDERGAKADWERMLREELLHDGGGVFVGTLLLACARSAPWGV